MSWCNRPLSECIGFFCGDPPQIFFGAQCSDSCWPRDVCWPQYLDLKKTVGDRRLHVFIQWWYIYIWIIYLYSIYIYAIIYLEHVGTCWNSDWRGLKKVIFLGYVGWRRVASPPRLAPLRIRMIWRRRSVLDVTGDQQMQLTPDFPWFFCDSQGGCWNYCSKIPWFC